MNIVNVVKMPSAPPKQPPAAPHVSVLLAECVEALRPRRDQLFLDATLGAGGHSEAILAIPGTRVIGIDRDDTALALASHRLRPFGDRFLPLRGRFSEAQAILAEHGIDKLDGLLADVGLSSMQLDDAGRGMSFRHEGPIDMRMDLTSGETALDLIERLDDQELADLIFKLGDERRSRRVARCIKQSFDSGELKTTLDLRKAVVRAVGPQRIGGVDPATRTFQALRIAVNGELEELSALLAQAPELVREGGTVAIISFHSLEDRLVKTALRDRSKWSPLTKKPMVAGDMEVNENPRSRSAKLRAARRIDLIDLDADSFDVDGDQA